MMIPQSLAWAEMIVSTPGAYEANASGKNAAPFSGDADGAVPRIPEVTDGSL